MLASWLCSAIKAGKTPALKVPSAAAEGEGGEDADLAAGVVPLDVGGGIAFRVAELLRHFERLVKSHLVVDHFGQDKVGCPVEDAGDLADLIGGQALVHGADDGDAAPDARLKKEIDVVLPRDVQKLGALRGDKLLVGGDDAFAVLQQAFDIIKGRRKAAHHLCNDRNFRIV